MGLWNLFKQDMKSMMPVSIKHYSNEETGEEAFEIINKPNRFVPTHVRGYDNHNTGISVYEAENKRPEFVEDMLRGKKCLKEKKQEQISVSSSY